MDGDDLNFILDASSHEKKNFHQKINLLLDAIEVDDESKRYKKYMKRTIEQLEQIDDYKNENLKSDDFNLKKETLREHKKVSDDFYQRMMLLLDMIQIKEHDSILYRNNLKKIIKQLSNIEEYKIDRLNNETLNIQEVNIVKPTEKLICLYNESSLKPLNINFSGPEELIAETDNFIYGFLIDNLLSNVDKYVNKGEVTLELKELEDSFKLNMNGVSHLSSVENLEKIVEDYHKGSDSVGYGLYLFKHSLNKLGGELRLRNIGGGFSFSAVLPKHYIL